MTIRARSSLGIKYPTNRDHPLHTGEKWLEGKRCDDGAEGFWRIHDGLYDLQNFAQAHPGGAAWIRMTRGTDITEAFESHHLSEVPEQMLPRFFVRGATSKRNFPFTFSDDGFYRTLKRRFREEMKAIPAGALEGRSKRLADALFASYIVSALLACRCGSFALGALAGVALSLTAIAAHNFFHKRDNFRMYYFDFSMMSSREWRISHVLSHHMYTNSVSDLEISMAEPFFQYLPTKKGLLVRYASWVYGPFLFLFTFLNFWARSSTHVLLTPQRHHWAALLPFTVPLLMVLFARQPPLFCIAMFLWIQVVGGLHFGIVGINAAHHHPDIFHDGDALRENGERDWGIYQMDAVMDRKDITGSPFLVLTHFGDHALHHLFPTLDHGVLNELYPAFRATCRQFGIEWRLTSQIELIKGQHRQLARTKANRHPPGRSGGHK